MLDDESPMFGVYFKLNNEETFDFKIINGSNIYIP